MPHFKQFETLSAYQLLVVPMDPPVDTPTHFIGSWSSSMSSWQKLHERADVPGEVTWLRCSGAQMKISLGWLATLTGDTLHQPQPSHPRICHQNGKEVFYNLQVFLGVLVSCLPGVKDFSYTFSFYICKNIVISAKKHWIFNLFFGLIAFPYIQVTIP